MSIPSPDPSRWTWIKRVALSAIALLAAGGLVYALLPQPVGVDVAVIGTGEMRVTVDEDGKTRISDVFTVSAPQAGTLLRTSLHVGDTVVANETEAAVLMSMAPPLLDVRTRSELEANVAAAEAAVAVAQAEQRNASSEAELATADAKRTRELARKGFAAERVLDRAETEARVKQDAVKRAAAAVVMREQQLQSARARLITATEREPAQSGPAVVSLKVPESGKVLRVLAESEGPVAAGTPIVEIGDPARLEIVVDLLSSDAVQVEPGAEAVVEGWGGSPLTARVRRIEPVGFTKVSALGIEEQRVRTILDFTGSFAERGALGHNFRVFVRILSWRAADALRVPLGALIRDKDRWAVFSVVDGRAILKPIVIGHRNPDFAEIRGGLSAGDIVILHPSDRVIAGVRVAPR